MAANWLKVDNCHYINANKVDGVRYLPSENKYEVYMSNRTMKVDTVEHATTFDITDEKEIKNETV